MLRTIILAVGLAMLVSGCSNSIKPSELPQMRITEVSVLSVTGSESNVDVPRRVAEVARELSRDYTEDMAPGLAEKRVELTNTTVRYKGAAMSILVGDAHDISATATLIGPDGAAERSGTLWYRDEPSSRINGVIGAVSTLFVNKAKADARLSDGLAQKAVDFAYGQKLTPAFVVQKVRRRRPASETTWVKGPAGEPLEPADAVSPPQTAPETPTDDAPVSDASVPVS